MNSFGGSSSPYFTTLVEIGRLLGTPLIKF